jgi:hypothetical protein
MPEERQRAPGRVPVALVCAGHLETHEHVDRTPASVVGGDVVAVWAASLSRGDRGGRMTAPAAGLGTLDPVYGSWIGVA